MINSGHILSFFFRFFTLAGNRKVYLLLLLIAFNVTTIHAQKPVIDFGEIPKCETTVFSVVDIKGDRYTWDIYRDSTVNFAVEKGDVDPAAYFQNGNYEGSTVNVNWLDTGSYFVRVMVWDEKNCTNNLMMFRIKVIDNPPVAEITGDSLCVGEPAIVKIVLTGYAPYNLTYTYGDGIVIYNLNGITENEVIVTIPPLPVGITEFWVTQIIDQCSENLIPSEKGRIVIFPRPVSKKIYVKDD